MTICRKREDAESVIPVEDEKAAKQRRLRERMKIKAEKN